MREASYVGTLTISSQECEADRQSSHQQFCHATAGRSKFYHMRHWDL